MTDTWTEEECCHESTWWC